MNCEIITIGDEILIGQVIDTNSQWLARQLNELGISVYQITSVQDKATHITKALGEAMANSNIVIITGGLGPTKDDITKTTLARFFQDRLVLNKKVEEHIKKLFSRLNFKWNKSDLRQAILPSKAQIIQNDIGTASGMYFEENEKIVVSLPGVPSEMKPMMQNTVLPKWQQAFKLPYILHKTLVVYGVRESETALQLIGFEEKLPKNIKLAYLPNYSILRLRLSGKGAERAHLEKQLEKAVQNLTHLLRDHITSDEEILLEETLGKLLLEKKKTLATAESCTGGNITRLVTSVPGASAYFVGSVVSYTAQVKIGELGVSEELIAEHSVVSASVAKAMALGVQRKFKTDYAVATTGNAGPTTDLTDKGVGDVYIAVATPKTVKSFFFNFGKVRSKVIRKASYKAMELLLWEILQNSK